MHRTRRAAALGLAGLWTVLLGACGEDPSAAADLLLVNGRVYSFAWGEPAADGTPAADAPYAGGRWHPDAEAIALRGGQIQFVGSAAEAERFRGAGTRVVDLGGATVLPGLIDSHTHVVELGKWLSQVNLVGVETEEEAVQRVVERAASVPKGEWIVGAGWDEGAWANHYPKMELLSERVPDHPVYLRGLHSFAAWGNRLAFERAGIDASTLAPEGGEILKDAQGRPTGVVTNRAVPLLEQAVPLPTTEQYEEWVLSGLDKLAEDGYVAVHEAGVDGPLMAALESLEAEGRLPLRVYAMLSARDTALMRHWLERGPEADAEGMLTVRSVKAYYDGALGSRGALLMEDYSDRPGHRGVGGLEYGFDPDVIARAMRGGFQVAIHAIGDAGNRETLEFLERVYGENPDAREQRHRIEHAQVMHPEDFERAAALGVIASMQPPHAMEDKAWAADRVGPDRIRGAYAWRSFRTAGVPLAFNSDLPGSDHDIFYGLISAVRRQDKQAQPQDGWYPAQRVTPEEAVRGYTSWGAFAAFQEGRTGVLAPGRWADLTVMDVDPMTLPADRYPEILKGSVVMTVANGKVVYERPGLAGK